MVRQRPSSTKGGRTGTQPSLPDRRRGGAYAPAQPRARSNDDNVDEADIDSDATDTDDRWTRASRQQLERRVRMAENARRTVQRRQILQSTNFGMDMRQADGSYAPVTPSVVMNQSFGPLMNHQWPPVAGWTSNQRPATLVPQARTSHLQNGGGIVPRHNSFWTAGLPTLDSIAPQQTAGHQPLPTSNVVQVPVAPGTVRPEMLNSIGSNIAPSNAQIAGPGFRQSAFQEPRPFLQAEDLAIQIFGVPQPNPFPFNYKPPRDQLSWQQAIEQQQQQETRDAFWLSDWNQGL